MEFSHYSVMLTETIRELCIRPGGSYLDGTLGGGGHAFAVCSRLSGGHFYGIDQDAAAIEAAGERLLPFAEFTTLIRDNYVNARTDLEQMGVKAVDGILLDLGVSSYQMDTPERGFSYRTDAPLDMRMDQRQRRTARDIVNNSSEKELFTIIRDYGEDPCAKNIARNIVRERAVKPIETTFELNEVISRAVPQKFRAGGHPSKQTFQALRIACNDELTVLSEALEDLITFLAPGGRFCIITFHSLEDRIVKTAFRKAENPCTCPPDFPVCVCGKKPLGRVVTRKPILPGEQELTKNHRSKSAKLRVFERCADSI